MVDTLTMERRAARALTTPRYQFILERAFDDGTEWQVVRMEVHEGLNQPYECVLELETDDPTAGGANMLGASCELLVDRTAQARRLRGLVARVEQVGSHEGTRTIRVRVVPALALLAQRRDSRIWQEMTVPQIVKEVLTQALADYGRTVTLDLRGDYAPREYCVQYQETDLDFVQRLLEEEGIGFWFDHEAKADEGEGDAVERMVLTDSNACFAQAQTHAGGTVTLSSRSDESADREALFTFDVSAELAPTRVQLSDYDWTRPSLDTRKAAGDTDHLGRRREIYLHRQPMQFHAYDQGQRRYDAETGARDVVLERDARTVRSRRARARGNVVGLQPGTTFDLEGHGSPDDDRSWLVVSVHHVGTRGVEDSDDAEPAYESELECIPADVAWVPPRVTPRPRTEGWEPARVVGPAGEEIHTDEHGRIKVRFPWDRSDRSDDRCSCWLRVQQQWAGPGYGFTFVPRVGMEVVVQFQGGNLDRPLVSGCVYNGENPPGLDLPSERTQSAIRTASTPGGQGYNELRFEDAAGEERLDVHAQRDMNVTVRRNQTTSVGGNRHDDIRGARSESVREGLSSEVWNGREDNIHTGNHRVIVTDGDQRVDTYGGTFLTSQLVRADINGPDSTFEVAIENGGPVVTLTPTNIMLRLGESHIEIKEREIVICAPKVRMIDHGHCEIGITEGVASVAAGTESLQVRRHAVDLHSEANVTVSATEQVAVQGGTKVGLLGGGAVARLENGDVLLNT